MLGLRAAAMCVGVAQELLVVDDEEAARCAPVAARALARARRRRRRPVRSCRLPFAQPLRLEARRDDDAARAARVRREERVAGRDRLRRLAEPHVVGEQQPPGAQEALDAFALVRIEPALQRLQVGRSRRAQPPRCGAAARPWRAPLRRERAQRASCRAARGGRVPGDASRPRATRRRSRRSFGWRSARASTVPPGNPRLMPASTSGDRLPSAFRVDPAATAGPSTRSPRSRSSGRRGEASDPSEAAARSGKSLAPGVSSPAAGAAGPSKRAGAPPADACRGRVSCAGNRGSRSCRRVERHSRECSCRDVPCSRRPGVRAPVVPAEFRKPPAEAACARWCRLRRPIRPRAGSRSRARPAARNPTVGGAHRAQRRRRQSRRRRSSAAGDRRRLRRGSSRTVCVPRR